MLNDTQKNLLDGYIEDYFISSADNLISSFSSKDEQLKAVKCIKKALTQSIVDFFRMIIVAYPRHVHGNSKKLLMLITLNTLINAEAAEIKFVKSLCDPRLSTLSSGVSLSEWQTQQQKLIATRIQAKMLTWIEIKKQKVEENPEAKHYPGRSAS